MHRAARLLRTCKSSENLDPIPTPPTAAVSGSGQRNWAAAGAASQSSSFQLAREKVGSIHLVVQRSRPLPPQQIDGFLATHAQISQDQSGEQRRTVEAQPAMAEHLVI